MLIEIIGQAKVGLSHLAAWFNVFAGSNHAETLVEINGREYHALALDTHHLAWFEIGYKEDALADKGGRVFVECGNATEDGAVGACSVVDSKLKELLRLLPFLAVFDEADADVEFLKVFKRYVVLDGSGFIGCCLVGFLGGFEFVELLLNDIVFNLLKQQ